MENIKVCIAYRHGKKRYDYMPNDVQKCWRNVNRSTLISKVGKTPTDKCKTWKDLPAKARTYTKAIAELTGAALSPQSARAGSNHLRKALPKPGGASSRPFTGPVV